MAQAISVLGVALAAALAYVLGLDRDRRAHLRAQQITSATEFCRLLMEYSGLQMRRRTDEVKGAAEDDDVVKALRSSRAAVWAAYFHVVLVIDDREAALLSRAALETASSVDKPGGPDDGDAYALAKSRADQVRHDAEAFVRRVALKLGVHAQSLESAPATDPIQSRTVETP